ncbi:MAG: RNA methyltransferase [Bacilli bacterium]|nr:RNA methyltransferase [Bacilli bacterium]
MVITSLENEKVKGLVKLQKKKYRDLEGRYVVEGDHLVLEAYKAGVVLELFILEGEGYSYDTSVTFVSYEVMKKITVMETVPRIVALCKKNDSGEILGRRILLLDELQDPGNLGTIIRSAVAFNIDTIILSENAVDLYNPKVLRATQGMYNYVNIIRMNSHDAIARLKDLEITVYGTNVSRGVDVRSLSSDAKTNFCLVMGNEGNGVRLDVQEMCDKNLYIKMNDNVESLNVGVACSILLYELS